MRRTLLALTVCAAVILAGLGGQSRRGAARPIAWEDAAPVRQRLLAAGLTAASFPSYIDTLREANARRVQEGDLDHLIFYLLQSTRFTGLPPIEPALSAKQYTDTGQVPAGVRARAAAFLQAVDSGGGDARLAYFRDLARAASPAGAARERVLLREYVRVMKFVYEKEFVAQRSGRRDAAIAELYRTRGLSTDTAVEAGFLVSDGLAVARALDPALRIRRVLIVGPGLDVAPRTGLLEASAPESYQPWAVIDALLALGLSRVDDLAVVGADINPRVVRHLRRASGRARTLTLVTGIAETENVTLSAVFRAYFAQLGRELEGGSLRREQETPTRAGHFSKTVRVDPAIARALHAEPLDIVTERLAAAPFDLVVATNIFPYFDDVELALALANVASMLAPGGLFLHNENRPVMEELTASVGLRLEQSRHSIIATVRGGAPLADSVFLHRKSGALGSALDGSGDGDPPSRLLPAAGDRPRVAATILEARLRPLRHTRVHVPAAGRHGDIIAE